jgi:hypothetical protein
VSSPNPELQGPENNPDPHNSSARAAEDRNPESESPHTRAFKNAGKDSDRSTPNDQVNATTRWSSSSEVDLTIHALRDFLSGCSTAPPILDSRNAHVRPLVVAELLGTITGADEEAGSQDPSRFDHQDSGELAPSGDESSGHQKQERARQLFIDYGYLDQAINSLRSNESPDDRAEAARTLGIVASERGTASLIAALFDDAAKVRKAAEKALSQIGDPSVSIGPVSAMIRGDINYGGSHKVGPSETAASSVEESKSKSSREDETHVASGARKSSLPQTTVKNPNAVAETAPALEELDQIRKDLVELERLLVEAVAARKEADKEVLVRAEQESAFRAEAAARRREDEETRKRAEEKAARRRSEDDRKIAAEQLGRLQAELEAQRLAEEEERLRREARSLMQTSGEIARQRAELEVSEFAKAAEARRLEAEDSLRIAQDRHNEELKRLRNEEEALHRATEEATAQRIEVEVQRREAEAEARQFAGEKKQLAEAIAARDAEVQLLREAKAQALVEQEELHQQVEAMLRVNEEIATRRAELEAQKLKAAEEVEHLNEAQERMHAAERIRREAETERLQREEELAQQVEKEQRLLAEIRCQAEAEQQRVEETSRLRVEEQDRRLAELETLRAEMEIEAQQRTENERRLNSEIDSFRAAEREALTRIGQVESLRNRAEETLHLAVEKVQRIEAEGRRRTMEDQRALDKLEETRRNLDLEAQARAEQEKHLNDEIEILRRREKEERIKIAEISSSRAEAEVRLHRERERLNREVEALAKAEAQIEFLLEPLPDAAELSDNSAENLQPESPSAPASEQAPVVPEVSKVSVSRESLLLNLRSADPYKRVTALAHLAHQGNAEDFDLIAGCFDDPSPQVRNAAARALRDYEPDRTVESFTRAIEEGSPERARNLGIAIGDSGLASEALQDLNAQSREDTYKALSLLFVMAKTGEIQPLIQAIEEHPELEVCNAAVKLLNLSGQSDAAEAALQRRREATR